VLQAPSAPTSRKRSGHARGFDIARVINRGRAGCKIAT
jgi:hypothetical protein